jgi:hypothetical protein
MSGYFRANASACTSHILHHVRQLRAKDCAGNEGIHSLFAEVIGSLRSERVLLVEREVVEYRGIRAHWRPPQYLG